MAEYVYDTLIKVTAARMTNEEGILWGFRAVVSFFDEEGKKREHIFVSPHDYKLARDAQDAGMWAVLELMEARNEGLLDQKDTRYTYTSMEDGWSQRIEPITPEKKEYGLASD